MSQWRSGATTLDRGEGDGNAATAGVAPEVITLRKNGLLVLSGYGVRVAVRRRHLVVEDGVGRDRRWGRFSRATAGLKRVVILGRTGTISLESLRWLRDIGAGVIQIDRDGQILSAFGPTGVDEPRLRRAQALAMTSPVGVEVARAILREKLRGEGAVLAGLTGANLALNAVRSGLDSLEKADSLNALLVVESLAARAYWEAWAKIPVTFARADAKKVPDHWRTFGQRGSPITGSPRLATNPVNAILGYLFAILEAETTIACLTVGLDPCLGILHSDQGARASMALDITEAIRPKVEAFVLEVLRSRVFRLADFHETPRGVCRVSPPLAHTLAKTSPMWAERVAPITEGVARILANASGAKIKRITTPLTESNRSAGRDTIRRNLKAPGASKLTMLPAACRICGVVLETSARKYCNDCLSEWRREHATQSSFAKAGPSMLRRMRTVGHSPSHGGAAGRKRGASIAKRNREAADWDRTHAAARPDPDEFKRDILPRLEHVVLEKIRNATGLSLFYCSLIRRGLYVPHPRHWDALGSLSTR